METIVRTKKQAIKQAKSDLRLKAGVSRLSYSKVHNITGRCTCGETCAVEVRTIIKGKVIESAATYCQYCGSSK